MGHFNARVDFQPLLCRICSIISSKAIPVVRILSQGTLIESISQGQIIIAVPVSSAHRNMVVSRYCILCHHLEPIRSFLCQQLQIIVLGLGIPSHR